MASTTISFLAIFFLSNLAFLHSAQEDDTYPPVCKPFYCGPKIQYIDFPFFNTTDYECGGLCEVNCSATEQYIKLGNKSKWYDLLSISQANTIEIRDQELDQRFNSQSCDSFQNFILPYSPSSSISFKIYNYGTFFKCTESTSGADVYFRDYNNYTKCPGYSLYYSYPNNHTGLATASLPPSCSIIQLPLRHEFWNLKSVDPFQLITGRLRIGLHLTNECSSCRYREGNCSYDKENRFLCSNGKEDKSNSKAILATATSGGVVAIICFIVLIIVRRKLGVAKYAQWGKKTESYYTVENFLKINGLVAPKRYCYSDIKKMTRSFKDKLGQGGYGYVYKGKLDNGSLVAVKVLKESKGNGEEFVNEVASISRTSHVNVVTLLGFCFEGRKRALIYEFMPNGSLEKFISNGIFSVNSQLGWDKCYRIAIGIARGLEYLHRGCNTRILHFDIKPHNILLDEDFIPKISDFGLAKLCPGKESAVSMLYARGTIGYIAPEVFCRNFGRVSHKSDVYSYGMMVLEIVGGRKNIEVEDGHTSEIYFPDWIYKKLESDKELRMYGMNEDENVYARKMIIVSLWCIQSNPSTRPSMSRVVEMLEGSLESLKIPPEPVLSSPPASPAHSSSIEIS